MYHIKEAAAHQIYLKIDGNRFFFFKKKIKKDINEVINSHIYIFYTFVTINSLKMLL